MIMDRLELIVKFLDYPGVHDVPLHQEKFAMRSSTYFLLDHLLSQAP